MNITFKKKITEEQAAKIDYYMKTHEKENFDVNIKKLYKTRNYTIKVNIDNMIFVEGTNYDWLLKILGEQKSIVKFENDYIGSDESGTGDFYGGIVVVAAYVKKENILELKKLNIKDSKKMTDDYILNIVDKVKKLCEYEIYDMLPKEYNEMHAKYKNIKKIMTLMHINVIEKLIEKKEIKKAVIDQFVSEKIFRKYMNEMEIKSNAKLSFFTKAEDDFFNVAVASIIARATFIKQINNLSNKAKKRLPKGASNPKIITIGESFLTSNNVNEFVKKDFKTIQKINFK